MRIFSVMAVAAAAVTLGGGVLAQNRDGRHDFAVPGHGSLSLRVPDTWQESSKPKEQPGSVHLRFRPPTGDMFDIQVTAVWRDADQLSKLTAESLKAIAQKSSAEFLRQAVEKEAKLEEFRGGQTLGYYYSLTDRAPPEGEYKYMTQGCFLTGELLTVFTILQREQVALDRKLALEMLADATYSSGVATGQESPKAASLEITESAGSYVLTVPVSRLVMTIPKGGLTLAENTRGAVARSPRYFYFTDKTLHLSISGWFESEEGFAGIKQFWANETAAWKRNGLPEPRDVSFVQLGNWNAIIYDLDVPSGRYSHIRAHWLQAGTWIDIHLSMAANLPQKELRPKLRDVLKTIQVTVKPS